MSFNGLNLHLSRRKNIASVLVLFLILVAEIIGIQFQQQIKNQFNDWKLLPKPERLTELYFTNPNNLPATYSPGVAQTVKFTTHNVEYQTETYQYKILEQSQDGSQNKKLADGQFTLQQNQYKLLSFTIAPLNMGNRVLITIELPTVNESISYWVVQQK